MGLPHIKVTVRSVTAMRESDAGPISGVFQCVFKTGPIKDLEKGSLP